jgi:5-methylcytosine-specific restriction endonuclease McrA
MVDCSRPTLFRELCSSHYNRWLRYGDPLGGGPSRTRQTGACRAIDCDATATSRGLCHAHANRERRYGDANFYPRTRTIKCDEPGCVESVTRASSGVCFQHYQKQYRIDNAVQAAIWHGRRYASLKSNPGYCNFTGGDWEKLKRQYGYCCAYCGEKPESLEMDHVIPVSRNGRHAIANILPACRRCNMSKFNKLLSEWKLWKIKQSESASAA